MDLGGAVRTERGEVHGAQELSPGRGESGRPAEPTPEVKGEVGAREARRPGVQRVERADRVNRAVGLEAGRGPAAWRLVGGCEEVQLGGGVEPGVNRAAERRLSKANEAAPSVIRRGAVQAASGRAEFEREVSAG